jgi:two-component system, sensor histidine kinase YesM
MEQKTRKKSLIVRAIALCVAIITLPALFSVIYFKTEVSSYLEKRAEDQADFYINELIDNDSTAMDMIRNTASYLISDKDIQAIMTKKESLTGVELSALQNTIGRTLLYNVSWVNKYISNLFIFRSDDVALTTFRSGVFNPEYIRMKEVYHELIDSSSMRSLYQTENTGNRSFFVFDYININNLDPVGKILIEVNTGNMVPADSLQKVYKGAEIILSDKNGRVLAISDDGDSDTIPAEFVKFESSQASDSGYTTWRGRDNYHRRKWLTDSDLKLDVFIPQDEILYAANRVSVWYSIIIIITLSLMAIISILTYLAISKPMKLWITNIEHMANGDFSVRMNETRYKETDKLVDTFNHLAENLDRLYHEAYTKGVLLRESEFKLLEAQINPHFIFNLLEAINLRCMEAGQKETSRMITDLAQLLRSNLGRQGKQKVTFEQELEYVNYYLNLQKARFFDDLTYTIDYEDSAILKYYLPKLTIQPLVENGVVHGLENRRGGGNVEVRIWEEGESVYISVADNGVGFDPSLIDDTSESSRHNHVALNNIKKRILLLYGEEGDMQIMSSPGHGTTVLVIIPIDKTEA